MSYYWFNKNELLEKVEEKYHNCGSKEKAAEYYQANIKAIKEKAKNKYNNFSEEEKEKKRQYYKDRYHKMKGNANLFLQYKR